MSRSPSKAPLITPSPSPAIRPPQKKKPRLDFDVDEARAASTMRMLDVWAQLADRYSRRLDEDDVIDLNTGQIIKDRGVIKSIPNKWEFGRFADERSQNEEEEDEEDEEDEDSADELDMLPRTEAKVQSEVEEQPQGSATEILQSKIRRVGALDLTNADDAEDLREFLAAERKRKELCGEDDSEDELATVQNTHLAATISTQLHTPPTSLTPDEFLVPFASSPLSSNTRSRTPSVTKRAPSKAPAKRAASKPSEEPRSSQPKSPNKVNKEKTPTPSSSPKRTTVEVMLTRRSQSRVPEDSPSNHKKVESTPLSRKGKEKAVDPPQEEQITYVNDSGADSDDEFAILDPVSFTSKAGPVASSSTDEIKTKQREGSKKLAKEEAKKSAKDESKKLAKESKKLAREESKKLMREESKSSTKEDFSDTVSKSTRKRKRAASSSEPPSPDISKARGRRASSSEPSPTATKHKHSKRRSKSKPRLRRSDSASDSESPPRSHRARSHFSALPESYYPYVPPPEHGQPPHYVPLFHPQAQLIISNAMHQLSTLFSSQPYPTIPFPLPGHGRHPYPTSSPYHTPRRHAESYYDPAFSHGTLPPSSPEPDSSPTRSRSEDRPRHSSLVSRSQSRGRRVSFRMQEGTDDVEFVDDGKATKSNNKKGDDQESPSADHPRKESSSHKVGKAKTKVLEKVSDSEEEDPSPRRGRSFRRGQTPAPPTRSDSDSLSKRSASRKRR